MYPLVAKEFQTASLDYIVYTTVRLNIKYPNHSGGGTGFFYNAHWEWGQGPFPFIVSNAHVLKDALAIQIHFHLRDPNAERIQTYKSMPQIMLDPSPYTFIASDTTTDLGAIYIGGIIDELVNWFATSEIPFIVPLTEKDVLSDEILLGLPYSLELDVIGYPNLLWSTEFNLPIYRRGYSATHPGMDYSASPFFLADITDTPGSSGSPVFALLNAAHVGDNSQPGDAKRFFLLGVLSSGLTRKSRVFERTDVPCESGLFTEESLNLARILRANELLKFFEEVKLSFPSRMEEFERLVNEQETGD